MLSTILHILAIWLTASALLTCLWAYAGWIHNQRKAQSRLKGRG